MKIKGYEIDNEGLTLIESIILNFLVQESVNLIEELNEEIEELTKKINQCLTERNEVIKTLNKKKGVKINYGN